MHECNVFYRWKRFFFVFFLVFLRLEGSKTDCFHWETNGNNHSTDIKCFVIHPEAKCSKQAKNEHLQLFPGDTSNAPLRNLIFEVFLVHQFFDLYVDKVKKYCYYTRFLRTSEELTQIVLNHQEVHRKFMSLLFCLIFLCLFVCQKKTNKQTTTIKNNNKTKGTQMDKYLELVWVNARYQ